MDLSAFGGDNAAAYEALVGSTGTIPSASFLPAVAPLAAPAGVLSDPEAVAELCKLVEARLSTLDADAQKMVEAHMDEFTLQRYVTARPASVEEAAAMFLGAMVWRVERGVAGGPARQPRGVCQERGRQAHRDDPRRRRPLPAHRTLHITSSS